MSKELHKQASEFPPDKENAVWCQIQQSWQWQLFLEVNWKKNSYNFVTELSCK